EELDEHPLVRRVEVLDHHVRDLAVVRHVAEELLERLEPAGGRADADDRKAGLGSQGGWSARGRRRGVAVARRWVRRGGPLRRLRLLRSCGSHGRTLTEAAGR